MLEKTIISQIKGIRAIANKGTHEIEHRAEFLNQRFREIDEKIKQLKQIKESVI